MTVDVFRNPPADAHPALLLAPIFKVLEDDLESMLSDYELPPFTDPIARNGAAMQIAMLCDLSAGEVRRWARDPAKRPPEARRLTTDWLNKRAESLTRESTAAKLLMRLSWARSPRIDLQTQVAVIAEILEDRTFLLGIRGWQTSNPKRRGKLHGRPPGRSRANQERDRNLVAKAAKLKAEGLPRKAITRRLVEYLEESDTPLGARRIQQILADAERAAAVTKPQRGSVKENPV